WRDGLAAGLVLLTSIWFFVYTRYVRPETLFVAALAWGFALALAGLEGGRRPWVVGGLAAFGAAGLAKDPLGAVAPIVALAAGMTLARRLRPLSRWLPPAGILPWVVLATWAVAVLAASAASRFRLPHYGLPAYPALGLLAVRAWRQERSGQALAFLFAGVFALFAVGCWVEIHRGGRDFIDRVIGLTDIYTRKEDLAREVSPLPPWESFRPLVP